MGLYYTPNPPHIGGAQPLEARKLTPKSNGVIFDAQSTADITGAAAVSFTNSTNLTIGSDAKRALVVMIAWSSTAPTGVSITWAGQALTLIPNTSGVNGAAGNTALYGLLNPTSGTQTLAGSWTGARDFYVAGIAFSNVEQSSLGNAFPRTGHPIGSSTAASITLNSRLGNYVVACFATVGTINSVIDGSQAYLDNTQTAKSAGLYKASQSTLPQLTTSNVTGAWCGSGCDVQAPLPPPQGEPPPFRQSAAILGCWAALTAAAAVLPIVAGNGTPPSTSTPFVPPISSVVFDSKSTGQITGLGGVSFTDSSLLTIGNNPNRALVVQISFGGAPSSISCTWDGQAMTQLALLGDSGFNNSTALFGLLNPNTGTKTLAGSWTNTADVIVEATSLYNVDQTSLAKAFPNTATAQGTVSPNSVAVTSAPGNMVIAGHTAGDFAATTFSATNNTTLFTASVLHIGAAGNIAAGAASITSTATQVANKPWTSAAVDVQAVRKLPARWPQEATIAAWIPPAPAPIVGQKLTPPSVVAAAAFPFRGSAVSAEVLVAWTPAPFFQVVQELLNPPITGTNNPPFMGGAEVQQAILNAWIPPPPAPIVAENLNPPISGTSNPPFTGARVPQAVLNAWIPGPPAAIVTPNLTPPSGPPPSGVIFESKSSSSITGTAAVSFTDSTKLTVAPNSNRALIVMLNFSGAPSGISVTWDGVPMTKLVAVTDATFFVSTTALFGLRNPNPGTHTLAGSWTFAADFIASGASFYNVEQSSDAAAFTGVTTGQGNSGPASVTVASAPGDMVVATHGLGAAVSTFIAANAIPLYNDEIGSVAGTGNRSPGVSPSVTMVATESDDQTWTSAGVDLKPPRTPPPPSQQAILNAWWQASPPAPITGSKLPPQPVVAAAFTPIGARVPLEVLNAWAPAAPAPVLARNLTPPSGVATGVLFDSQSTSAIVVNGAASFTDSARMTVGGGANRALVVLMAWSSAVAPTGISLTWDGQPLTLIPGTLITGFAETTALYGLLNPNSGTKTLAGSWTGTTDFYAAAASFINVDQTSISVSFPNGTTNSNASVNPSSVTITSAVNDMVVGVFSTSVNFVAVTGGTQIFLDGSGLSSSGAGARDVGAPSVTLTVSNSGNSWIASGTDIKFGGASTAVPFGSAVPQAVLNAWSPVAFAPIVARNLTPPSAPAASFPPLGSFVSREVLINWIPPAPMPIVAVNLNPPQSGPTPQNPPFPGSVVPIAVQVAWLPPAPAPIVAVLLNPPQSAPPTLFFAGGSRVPGEVLINWLPPVPAPLLARNGTPPSGPAPTNPVFDGGARLRLEIQLAWQAVQPGYPPLKAINKTPPSGGAVAPAVLHAKPFFVSFGLRPL